MTQGTAQRFELTLVSVALTLKLLKHLEDFIHQLLSFLQIRHNLIHVIDRFLDSDA